MTDTFIERHGLIKYGQARWRRLPCPRWCEICRSTAHVAYGFDHCHVHGWVRGILCGPCNTQMQGVDAGKIPLASPYVEHWRRCPDCLKIGVVTLPVKRPRRPRAPVCAGCSGNGVIWLASIGRMADCPVCRHAASPHAVGADGHSPCCSAVERPARIVTERDQNGAPESDQGRAHAFSANFVRASFPGHGTTSDTCSPSVSYHGGSPPPGGHER